MKKILLFLCLCISTLSLSAAGKDPEARKILDATANRLSSCGGIRAQFTATNLIGKQEQGSTTGTMCLLGKKFQMTTPDMLTWFDGKTQWSMQPGDNEVSMQEPTGAELQAMNPYACIGVYKKGFNYKKKEGQLINGKQGYKITLNAENKKQKVQEIYIEIDQDLNPVRVSLRQGKNNWTRLVITNFTTGHKYTDKDFTFPAKDYPKAEVIDLR